MLLDVFKDGELVDTIEISASKRVYKVGRQAGVADIVLSHGSISREHATITVSASGSVVVADLGSAQGTKISGKALLPKKPHLLPPGRSLVFGQSTRSFKLREGGSGFVSGAAVAQAPPPSAIDDPRLQPLLRTLRAGAADCERLRPDGYVRLVSLLGCADVQRSGCTEVELTSLPVRFPESVEATSDEDGQLLLRALGGHEEAARVDLTLQLRPSACSPPKELVFCSSFVGAGESRACAARRRRVPSLPVIVHASLSPPLPPSLPLSLSLFL